MCTSCKKKGRTCTWTPIKLMKNRVSRKHGGKIQPPSRAHNQVAHAGPQQPYLAAQMQTYPNAVRPGAHDGTSFAPAVQGQLVSTPSSGLVASNGPIIGNYWSYPGVPLRQEWIPPTSYYPCFSNDEGHLRTHQRLHNDCYSSMIASSSTAK